MSSTSERLAKKVKKLIDKYGDEMTLRKRGTGVYDPALLTTVPGPAQTHTVHGLHEPDNYRGSANEGMREGTSVRLSRKKVSIAASGLNFKPESGDVIGPIEGKDWTVSGDPENIGVDGTSVIYVLRVTS